MTEITKAEVQKIAKLARIKFADNELDFFSKEVERIITWVEKLDEVNTENISPLFAGSQQLNMFNDEIEFNDLSDEVLSNSPKRQFDFFAVPKMVDG